MSAAAWRKLGLVYRPGADRPWRLSHAATPTVQVLSDTLVRVYFTSRDAANRSHISSLEMDLRHIGAVRALSADPLVAPGPTGAFDDSGTAMGCLVSDGAIRRLYYLGWNISDRSVPWRNSIGLAISPAEGQPFEKVGTQPVLGRNDVDPHSLSYPWIGRDGAVWRMWYGSNLGWGATEETMRHVIKYAESRDGLTWDRRGDVAIPLGDAPEFAVARPCVVVDDGTHRMWYSRRSPDYRIGYAESADGRVWVRRDDRAGIEPSGDSWESRTVEYACVFDAGGERYMVYNGNDYGREGFGLAIQVR